MFKTSKKPKSQLEETLALHLRASKLPDPVREHRFHPTRRWRFDFAWPDRMLAVECEGGQYTQGRHQRPAGFAGDSQKYNEAQLLGWVVLRFTGDMVRSGEAVGVIERALNIR